MYINYRQKNVTDEHPNNAVIRTSDSMESWADFSQTMDVEYPGHIYISICMSHTLKSLFLSPEML